MAASDQSLVFGSFQLSPARRTLLKDGQSLPVGSRAFDVLVVLLERAGQPVAPAELIGAVWGRTVVEPGTLRVHIAALRKALAIHRSGDSLVEFVPGKGYRLNGLASRSSSGEAKAERLIGRDGIVFDLVGRLSNQRCVTIIGPGGIGKTAVARAIAEICIGRGETATLFDLANVGKAGDLLLALAEALGIDPCGPDPLRSTIEFLCEGRHVLIFDNCDYLVDEAAKVAEKLLHAAPGLRILATGRESLRIEGEWIHRLEGLDVPSEVGHATSRASLEVDSSAMRLLLRRYGETETTAALDAAEIRMASEICRRVDGNPLAIEFIAARARSVGLGIAAQEIDDLEERTEHGSESILPLRHALRDCCDRSFEILTKQERFVLVHLSSMDGPFSIQEVSAACEEKGFPSPCAVNVSEAVFGLVAKSVLVLEMGGNSSRYRLPGLARACLKTQRERVAKAVPEVM